MFLNSLEKLYIYSKIRNYRGWDLFDGLNSSLFQSSILNKRPLARLCFIQLFKRSPINFRKTAKIPEGFNSKGLALFVSGLVCMKKFPEAARLLKKLQTMSCMNYTEKCWGYNFDWQARAFFVPKGNPNIISTIFVANAYLDYLEQKRTDDGINCLVTAISACRFIMENLVIFEDSDQLCFGYIPEEKAVVHNANMLGAALLARVYALTGNDIFYEKSRKAMNYSVSALKPDFSWPYGSLQHHQFVDSFHTGFNLVALKNWMDSTNERHWEKQLKKAYNYYLDRFWLHDGCPRYYNNSLYPIDIHCSAQGIITCLKLADYDDRSLGMAEIIGGWAIKNMQDKKGFFYYQKTRWFINRIPYIRWSQAWMFYALSLILIDDN